MKTLELIKGDNAILFENAEPIEDVTSKEVQDLIDDLIHTSITIGGYGLAAPQVGISKQLFVYRKALGSDIYKVVINPEVVVASGQITSSGEGCLSHPGYRTDLKRAKTFVISCLDRNGNRIRLKGSNKKEAVILQHEYDHLQGITIKTKR